MQQVRLPKRLEPLAKPARYKILYGGRGSGKSWSVARLLLVMGAEKKLRILCTREIQRTISESVHQLLRDQLAAMGLSGFYTVTETSITGKNGTQFLFAGLRQQDVAKIKSFEGVDIVWVEEAQVVTKKSWDILVPTIRKPGSEIWVTFNPELDTDETYVRFVAKPQPDSLVLKLTYADNEWFPDVLERERSALEGRDPEAYANVWEGQCRSSVDGAIYAKARSTRSLAQDSRGLGSRLERRDDNHHRAAQHERDSGH
jgi:phage terminase large subunit